MTNYIIRDGELRHYGVLGMKWGVRRGQSSRAFRKASKKAVNLDNKYTETNLQSAKLRSKALRKMAKATNERKYKKARELEFEAAKLELKSAKLLKKGKKWQQSMEKTFADVKLSDISPEDRDFGRQYVYMLINK